MIEILRGTGPVLMTKEPLTWRLLGTKDGPSASFVCSNGHDGTLTDHTILPDGNVSPSVVCNGDGSPDSTCDFHDHILLLGWAEA